MTGRPSPPADERPVVAIDPGRDKCGLAVVFSDGRVAEHSVVPRPGLMAAVREAVARHQPVAIVIGNRTGSRDCRRELTEQGIGPIVIVEEHETTQRARARYFRDNPPRGWRRLAPIGMLTPLRPVDDYAAILLAEAYWEGRKGAGAEAATRHPTPTLVTQIMSVAENIERIRERIALAAERSGRKAGEVTLVAVTKKQPAEAIQSALDAGLRDVGENYVAEAAEKFSQVLWPEGATRHLIGHLQGNKAARAIETFDMIQSVDTVKLARRLDANAEERAIILPVLIEVQLTDEPEKTGILPEDLPAALEAILALPHLSLRGLMGMAPFTEDKNAVRSAFRTLRNHFLTLDNDHRRVLSMGMTGDFETAIEEGSTMVRIGTAIFGARTV